MIRNIVLYQCNSYLRTNIGRDTAWCKSTPFMINTNFTNLIFVIVSYIYVLFFSSLFARNVTREILSLSFLHSIYLKEQAFTTILPYIRYSLWWTLFSPIRYLFSTSDCSPRVCAITYKLWDRKI